MVRKGSPEARGYSYVRQVEVFVSTSSSDEGAGRGGRTNGLHDHVYCYGKIDELDGDVELRS